MPNKLIEESSPYLLQHAHNPVDWYAWGDEPFERAKTENKPVLVSIGYSACHWCHVMEHESFENEEVAAYMNKHFINIKVDREEYPAVDHFYMDAVQAITGSGGWPLNVFVTPERVPFYGGTYFPPRPVYGRSSWMQVMESIAGIWAERQDDVALQTGQMLQYLQNASRIGVEGSNKPINNELTQLICNSLLKQADTEKGGFGKAPKFPGSMAISYLLEYYHYTGDKAALQHALKSLDAMLQGGIYDQLGGGFARYATDNDWLVPHFEKMLYDNALLIASLCDAYSITKEHRYKAAIEETIAFAERELKSPEGLYYSALDADSEGVEGKFYTWTWQEWDEVISDEFVTRFFGVSEHGNWEHTNILHTPVTVADFAARNGVDEVHLSVLIERAKKTLLDERGKRIRPGTDDKSLLSWNALMNMALARAAMALGNEQYRKLAEDHMASINRHFTIGEDWMHTWKQGKAKIPANLDDIAYLAKAMIQLASASGMNEYLQSADELLTGAIDRFLNEEGRFFYYSSSAVKDIPVRKVETYDGATPSANAVMAECLLLAGMFLERNDYADLGYNMLTDMASAVSRYSYSFSYWAMVMQRYAHQYKTIVCSGEEANETVNKLNSFCIPEALVLTSQKEISELAILKGKFSDGKNTVHICTQESCLPPKSTWTEVLEYLGSIKN
ncbi:MAG: thioredoxin domain-containing protein [Bacteroidetes bacterium]|nr:thioredoxin domain-containing protein [Bacteroidota bacterium]